MGSRFGRDAACRGAGPAGYGFAFEFSDHLVYVVSY